MQASFVELCRAEAAKAPYIFRVALGGAAFDETQDHFAEDTVRRADRLMYCNKQQMKRAGL